MRSLENLYLFNKEMVHDKACSIEPWVEAGGWESTKKA